MPCQADPGDPVAAQRGGGGAGDPALEDEHRGAVPGHHLWDLHSGKATQKSTFLFLFP